MSLNKTLSIFPKQSIPTSQKTKDWGKQNIESALQITITRDQKIREDRLQKRRMYDLYNSILDRSHIDKTINPHGFKDVTFPATMQNYPISRPKIDLLIGEESKRRFEWRLRVINPSAVSEKAEELKEQIMQKLVETTTAGITDENILREKIDEIQKWANYDYQDIRERTGTLALNYLYKEQDIKTKFTNGFKDALIAGEEIYRVEIIAGEPQVEKVNPLNLYTIGMGESHKIEDADLIIEDQYYSGGYVIDRYFDDLKPAEVKALETGVNTRTDENVLMHRAMNPSISIDDFIRDTNEGMVRVNEGTANAFGSAFDDDGNVRVSRVVWRSRRKIGKLTFFDEENNEKHEWVDENYKADTSKGEKIKWLWVNEWWEGTKIANDIYVRVRPIPRIGTSMSNPSIAMPPYVGTVYNINDSRSKSLLGLMAPYQYLFNVYMYQTELAFSTSHGKIARLDISRKPDGWSTDQWMYYFKVMKVLVEDSFVEGKKGMAQGKLAGNFNTSGATAMDLENGAYIQQHLNMLLYLDQQMGRVAGITEQREGQVQQRELVGNVERAVTQSSHITEAWFDIHQNTKLRLLKVLLETAKFAWKNQESKKLQYILDDLSTTIFELDPEVFAESEFGLVLSSSQRDAELIQTLKQLTHAAIQNGNADLSTVIGIHTSESVSEMTRSLEKQEQDTIKRQEAQEEAKRKSAEKIAEMNRQARIEAERMAIEKREDEQAHDMEKQERDWDRKTDHEVTIETLKQDLERLKVLKEKKITDDEQKHETQEKEKDRKLTKEIEEKKNQIEREKIKTDLKVKRIQNNQKNKNNSK